MSPNMVVPSGNQLFHCVKKKWATSIANSYFMEKITYIRTLATAANKK